MLKPGVAHQEGWVRAPGLGVRGIRAGGCASGPKGQKGGGFLQRRHSPRNVFALALIPSRRKRKDAKAQRRKPGRSERVGSSPDRIAGARCLPIGQLTYERDGGLTQEPRSAPRPTGVLSEFLIY